MLLLDCVVTQILHYCLRDAWRQHEGLEVVLDPWMIDVFQAVDQRTAGEGGDPLERERMRAEEAGSEGHGELESRVSLQKGGVQVQVALAKGYGRGLGGDLL